MSAQGRLTRGPSRIFWGDGALEQLPLELARAGVERPLVVGGASTLVNSGLAAKVDAALGIQAPVFGGVKPQSPLEAVSELVQLVDDLSPDCLILVGGGSSMVTGRAAAMISGEGKDIAELSTFESGGSLVSPRLLRPKLPIFAIPTTPTTATGKVGAAVTAAAHHGRHSMFDPATRARAIFVVPEALLSTPWGVVQTASLNALVMALEGLLSPLATTFSDAVLTHGARSIELLLADKGRDVGAGDLVQLTLLALLVGEGTDTAGGGVCAALSHTVARQVGQPNGLVDAILLSHRLVRDQERTPQRVECVTSWLGWAAVATRVQALLNRLELPTNLRSLGMAYDAIDALAVEAMGDFSSRTDPTVSADDLSALLRRAW